MELKDLISWVLSVLALVIPLVIFIVSSPERMNVLNITIFVSIGILLFIFSFLIYFVSKFNIMNINVRKNSWDTTGY